VRGETGKEQTAPLRYDGRFDAFVVILPKRAQNVVDISKCHRAGDRSLSGISAINAAVTIVLVFSAYPPIRLSSTSTIPAQLVHVLFNESRAQAVRHVTSSFEQTEAHIAPELPGADAPPCSMRWRTLNQSRKGLLVFSKTVPATIENRQPFGGLPKVLVAVRPHLGWGRKFGWINERSLSHGRAAKPKQWCQLSFGTGPEFTNVHAVDLTPPTRGRD